VTEERSGPSDARRRLIAIGLILGAAALGIGLARLAGPDRRERPRKAEEVEERVRRERPARGRDVAHPAPIVPPERPPPPGPSVLLVTLDTTRADHLGTYGYFRDTSPTLDALAREAIVFDRYLVPMSITLPSHMTLLTATYPDEHGIVANMAHGGKRFVASPALESFAQIADQAGYVTAGIVSSSPLKKYTGVAEGFQQYYEPAGEARHARETTDLALEWLAIAPDRPFFLWVHYFDPHWPYQPPPRWAEAFQGADAEAQEKWFAERKAVPADVGLAKVRAKIDKYDAEIRYMDHQIGRLFEALRAADRWDDLVVVVVGDHGEGLMQHAYPSHGHVWSEQINAPLMIRIPGEAPRRITDPVGGIDVLPTVLGRIEVPGEEVFLAQASGRDVLAGNASPVVFRTSEIQHDKATDTKFAKPVTWGISDARWTLHDTDGEIALYDRRADPHELTDVAAAHPDEVSRLSKELAARRSAQLARGKQFGAGGTAELTDEEKAALEALGYVDAEPHE
jgi:arylsulfatase A-like enzyme